MYKIYIEEIINMMNNKIDISYKREREIFKEIYILTGCDGVLSAMNNIIDTLNEIGYSSSNIEYIHGLEKCWKEVLYDYNIIKF